MSPCSAYCTSLLPLMQRVNGSYRESAQDTGAPITIPVQERVRAPNFFWDEYDMEVP